MISEIPRTNSRPAPNRRRVDPYRLLAASIWSGITGLAVALSMVIIPLVGVLMVVFSLLALGLSPFWAAAAWAHNEYFRRPNTTTK